MASPAAAATTTPAESPVVLINIFQVAPTQEEAFVAAWNDANEYLQQQDGFISTKLHESLQADATYRFINVAQWQSAQQYKAAVGSESFRQIAQSVKVSSLGSTPGLYHVVAE